MPGRRRSAVVLRMLRTLATVTLAAAMLTLAAPAVTSGAAIAVATQDAPAGADSSETAPSNPGAPVTTSTLPVSNGEIGNIVPKPNSGAEPTSPSDRGGWQQLALFVLICATVIAMGVAVWLRSRTVRKRQRAAGYDRVADARAHGGDVRAPRPPGILD